MSGSGSSRRWGGGKRIDGTEEGVTKVDTDPAPPSTGAPIAATFEVVAGPDEGTIHVLEAPAGILGRAPDVDIRFTDPTISRAHVRIDLRGGVFHIKDLGSSNGTRVDGRNLRGQSTLRPHARLRLGKRTEVEFTAVDEPALRRTYKRMHLEERLALERKYSHVVAEKAHRLRGALDDVERFASAASHDLRAPLHTIGALTELLGMQYRGQLDDKADEYIRLVVEAVHRMDRLLTDLRAYSRIGSDETREGLVDLDEVLDDVLDNLRAALDDADAEVARGTLPTVVGNRSQMVQLLQNLIGNAVKFKGPRPLRIEVHSDREGDEWIVRVADNGVGFDPKYADQIFEVFKRAHAEGQFPGTGMGLAIAHRIVQLHGGRIRAEAVVDASAVFEVTLPCREGDIDGARDTVDPDLADEMTEM